MAYNAYSYSSNEFSALSSYLVLWLLYENPAPNKDIAFIPSEFISDGAQTNAKPTVSQEMWWL